MWSVFTLRHVMGVIAGIIIAVILGPLVGATDGWQLLLFLLSGGLGYAATTDLMGMTSVNRLRWLLRGIAFQRWGRTICHPDDLPGTVHQARIVIARRNAPVRPRRVGGSRS